MKLVDGAAVQRRVNRRCLPPLFLVALACQIDRSNLAYAALQLSADLSFFTRTVQGLGSGCFFIGYSLLQIPANAACMALGPRRWLPIILLAWGALAMCFAAMRSTAAFLVLRLLLGAAEAGAYPAIMFHLSLFYTPRNLGLAYTVVATATAVAGLMGGPLAAGIMSLDGAAGLRGWQWLFLLEGVPPLLLAAALPFWLPTSPLTASFLSPEEQQWLWRQVNGQEAGIELVAAAPAEDGLEAGSGVTPAARLETALLRGPEPAAAVAAAAEPGAAEPEAQPSAAARPAGPAESEHAELLAAHKRAGGKGSEGGEAADSASPSSGGRGGGLRAAARRGLADPRVWVLGLLMLLVDVCMNAIHFWLPTLVKASLQGRLQSDEDGDEDDAAAGGAAAALAPAPAPLHAAAASGSLALLAKASLLSALPFCGAAVCMVANAWHARRTDERRLHVAAPMLTAALAWGVLPPAAAVGPGLAIAALTVAASGIWATHGPLFSWPAALLDRDAAAMGFALVKTCGSVGAFLGPFLIGWMADLLHGYTGAMLMLAGVAAAAAALVCVFNDAPS
ncbi:hypothetical protein ABPG75_007599 [Micractinium tetrahymenae]